MSRQLVLWMMCNLIPLPRVGIFGFILLPTHDVDRAV